MISRVARWNTMVQFEIPQVAICSSRWQFGVSVCKLKSRCPVGVACGHLECLCNILEQYLGCVMLGTHAAMLLALFSVAHMWSLACMAQWFRSNCNCEIAQDVTMPKDLVLEYRLYLMMQVLTNGISGRSNRISCVSLGGLSAPVSCYGTQRRRWIYAEHSKGGWHLFVSHDRLRHRCHHLRLTSNPRRRWSGLQGGLELGRYQNCMDLSCPFHL